jgi:hypothetical protein
VPPRMGNMKARSLAGILGACGAASAYGQVPDLLNAFDAGSAALGGAWATGSASADALGATFNPAAIGYLQRPTATLARRNVPKSRTTVGGTYDAPTRSTSPSNGSQRFTHAGFALPASRIFKGLPGAVSFGYSLAAWTTTRAFPLERSCP